MRRRKRPYREYNYFDSIKARLIIGLIIAAAAGAVYGIIQLWEWINL